MTTGTQPTSASRLPLVALYAIAMANVEAVVVVYLRELHGIDDLIRDLPTVADRLVAIEIGREAATVAMLLAVGWLAGRRLQDRLGHFVFAFGVWDIAYYGWLALIEGWPRSPLDWDVLFLIPVPWWGPVLAPALIAAVMCLGGAAAVRQVDLGVTWRLTWVNVAIAAAGLAIVLYTFTADGLSAVPDGLDAVAGTRPSDFQWPLFALGFAVMSWAGLRITWPGPSRLLRT
ncbi:MAG: hypothetical protein IIC26_05865 [Chloroflexi bacterium]|nr:hypothetical protein [Chloroflexota bacterium]